MTQRSSKSLVLGLWLLVPALLFPAAAVAATGSNSSSVARINPKLPPYKVGAVFALTGTYSGTDKDSAASLKATIAEINANGGVLGHRLIYRIVDSQSDPAKAALAAQQVAEQYKPHVMVPDIVCPLALSALPMANRLKLLTFTGCDNGVPSNPAVNPLNFSTFPPLPATSVAMVSAATHVMKGKKMTVGFLHANDASGFGMVQPVKLSAELKGHEWAGSHSFTVGTPDLTVPRLRQAGADVVIVFGQVGDGGNVMKSVRDLSWDVQVIGGVSTVSANLVDEIPNEVRDNFHALVTALSIRKPGSPLPPPWINTYLRRASTTVQTLSVVGAVHDGLTLWKWAVERIKSTNAARVARELEKLGTLPKNQLPKGLQLTTSPMYSSTQHGLRNANLNRAWGIMRPSRNIMGTYEGEIFTCYCAIPTG